MRKRYNAFLPLPTGIEGAAGDLIKNLVAPITNLFKGLFGSNYQTTTGPRWLAAWYKHYVLGQQCESPTKCVGDSDVPPAQAWFTAVTGVPIYDRYRLAALQGWDLQNDRSLNNSDSDRVDNYMKLGPLEASVSPDIVMSAVQIAKNLRHHAPVGSWAQYGRPAAKMAKQVVEYLPGGTGSLSGSEASGDWMPPGETVGGKNWLFIGIIAVVVIVIIVIIAKRR